MKIISKFILFFLIVVAVSACNTKEIDNPDNQNPDKSLVSDIKLTANIMQTRVNYSVNGGLLTQCWAEGDVIYGFYGSGTGSKVILTVEEVVDGIATLKPESGYEGFVAALKNQIKTQEDIILPFGLVYTGVVDAPDEDVLFTDKGKINVLLSKQDIGQIPACLQSVTYKIIPGKSEEKIVQFIFSNECAILEIESLTGIAEDAEITEGSFMELSSIKVSSSEDYNPLYNHIEFSYNGGLQSSSESSDYYNKFVAVSSTTERPLRVDDKGNIVDGQGNKSCIRIAVYPQGDVILKVTATPSDGEDPFISEYEGTLSPGNCYIISSKDVVAKTEDGLYFTSVSAAFDHAAVLAETLGNDNTVTLVKDYINGLNEDVAHEVGDYPATIIYIDYPVSLDLNGCTLSLDCDGDLCEWDSFYSGGFEVESGGTLTIDDSGDSGCIDSGSRKNDKGFPIITNSGTVNIVSGELNHWEAGQVIYNTGVLNIFDGGIQSFYNPEDEAELGNYSPIPAIDNFSKNLTISGGEISGYYALRNNYNAKASITGGTFDSTDDSAVVNYGDLIVGDPDVDESLRNKIEIKSSINSPDCPAIYNSSSNGSFNIYYGNIIGVVGAVEIKGGLQGNIYGGYFESTYDATILIIDGGKCDISGGVVYNKEEGTSPAVLCYSGVPSAPVMSDDGTSLTIRWPNNDESVGSSIHEPLIYTNTKDSYWCSPVMISRSGNEEPNFAKININGGILYSGNGAFYRQVIPTKSHTPSMVGDDDGYLNPLKTGNITSFYSNSYSLYEGSNKKQLSTEADSVYGLTAIIQTGSGFQKTIDGKNVSFDDLYKISK